MYMHQALPFSIFIAIFITSHSLSSCIGVDYGAVNQCRIKVIVVNCTCKTWFNHRVLVYVTLVDILIKMELKLILQDRFPYYTELSQ